MRVRLLLSKTSVRNLTEATTPMQAWWLGLPVRQAKDVVITTSTTKATTKVAKTTQATKVAKTTKAKTTLVTKATTESGKSRLAMIQKEVRAIMALIVQDPPRTLPGFVRVGFEPISKVGREVLASLAQEVEKIRMTWWSSGSMREDRGLRRLVGQVAGLAR